MKTKYPKWFKVYSKHCKAPSLHKPKPKPELIKHILISTVRGNYSMFDIPEGATEIELDKESTHDYEGAYDTLVHFYKTETYLNPNYEKELKEYNKAVVAHKEIVKEWRKFKKIWLQEQEEENIAREKAQFEKLKEIYGKS